MHINYDDSTRQYKYRSVLKKKKKNDQKDMIRLKKLINTIYSSNPPSSVTVDFCICVRLKLVPVVRRIKRNKINMDTVVLKKMFI